MLTNTGNLPSTSVRDPYFDNARGLLIILVVVGHLLLETTSEISASVTVWIYSFHMPAFIAVTGHLSRRYSGSPRQASRLITLLIVPYLAFQLFHELLAVLVLGKAFSFDPFTPRWTLWFLLALLIWRLLTPILRALRFALIFAVAIAVLSPMSEAVGPALSLGRILGFLPFYVLGLVVSPAHLALLRTRVARYCGAAYLVGALVVLALYDHLPNMSLFYLSKNYAERDIAPVKGAIIQLVVLTLGLMGTAAILAITSTRKTPLTRLGERSLYIYLLHAIVLYPFRYLDWAQGWDAPWQIGALIVGAVTLAFVLASRPVTYLTRWVVEPPIARWLTHPSTARLPHEGKVGV